MNSLESTVGLASLPYLGLQASDSEDLDSKVQAARKRTVSFEAPARTRTISSEVAELTSSSLTLHPSRASPISHSPYNQLKAVIHGDLTSNQDAATLESHSNLVTAFVKSLLSERATPSPINLGNPDYHEIYSSLEKLGKMHLRYRFPLLNKVEANYSQMKSLIEESSWASHLAEMAGMVAFVLKNLNKPEEISSLQSKLALDKFLLCRLPYITKEEIQSILDLKSRNDTYEKFNFIFSSCREVLLFETQKIAAIQEKDPGLFESIKGANKSREAETLNSSIKRFEYLEALFTESSTKFHKDFQESFDASTSSFPLSSRKQAPSPIGLKRHSL